MNHREGDVSIIQLFPFDNNTRERFKQSSFPISQIHQEKLAIPMDFSIVTIGYPLIDEFGEHFSPLVFNSSFSSGLITLKRADTHVPAVFQLLENPSIQGLSGGPVLVGAGKVGVSIGWKYTMLVGIVHGTYSDNTGGKMGMISPSFYIMEMLK